MHFIKLYSLKVAEKCLWVSSSMRGKSLPTPSGREWAIHRRRSNECWNKDSPSIKCQCPSRRVDEQVQVKPTSCPQDGKLFLKADEPQFGQRHEDVKRKWEYYHITIFPERTEFLHKERRGQVNTIVMEHLNSIILNKFRPANKQHTY